MMHLLIAWWLTFSLFVIIGLYLAEKDKGMASKQDYKATAEVLGATLDQCKGDVNATRAVLNIAQGMANVYAADNARFSRDRFLSAVRGD